VAHGVAGQSTSHQNIGSTFTAIGQHCITKNGIIGQNITIKNILLQ
jgi:hypothetical protein